CGGERGSAFGALTSLKQLNHQRVDPLRQPCPAQSIANHQPRTLETNALYSAALTQASGMRAMLRTEAALQRLRKTLPHNG
ncbi:MAG: hypothetical protein WCC64_00460, partial [Aliidongia sp.]